MPTIHPAPFALTSDGTVLINTAEMTAAASVEEILAWLVNQEGPLFIGVVMTASETKDALVRLDDALADAAAHLAGGRTRIARHPA